MANVKNKNTKAEVKVRKALFRKGLRYRINDKRLPGSPDIVLPKYRTVIFVHGCYWHGHKTCKKAITPNSNVEFWNNKIEKNQERDFKVLEQLNNLNWNVITVWECEIKNRSSFELTIENLIKSIKSRKERINDSL